MIFDIRNDAFAQEYCEHAIFSELDEYISFYNMLSFSVMGFITAGTRSFINLDTYFYGSMEGTIDSIKTLLTKGRINDAYCLSRKYHDSIIINAYSIVYLEDNFSLDNLLVEQIYNWIHGADKLPEYRLMSQYLKSSKRLEGLNNCLDVDARYKEIRLRCNNHTHYNYFKSVLLNDSSLHLDDRLKVLSELSNDVKNLFVLHLSYLFLLKCNYMGSSDYIDSLDCGIQPPEDSQYWVAPFVQDVFNKFIKELRPDIASLILNETCMHLK